MEILRVQFPLMKVIPFREAEAGQVLEAEVYARNDHLIAERGTKIDENLITRFDNFDVRRIVVREQQETWITDQQIGGLPPEAQVTQRRTVRGTLAEHTRELFGKQFDQTMKELLEKGLEEAERRNRGKLIQDLKAQQNVVDELSDRLSRIRGFLTDLPEKTRSRIDAVIRGTALDLGRDFLQLPGPETKLRKCLTFFADRDEARNELIHILSEYSDVFEDVEQPDPANPPEAKLTEPLRDLVSNGTCEELIEELTPEDRSELNDEAERILTQQEQLGHELKQDPSTEPVGRALLEASEENVLVPPSTLDSAGEGGDVSIPDRARRLLEKRNDLREKARRMIGKENNVGSDEDEENSEPPATTDSIKKLLDVFDAGQRKKAVQASIGFLRKQEVDTDDYEQRLADLYDDIEELQEENDELHEAVQKSARHPKDREYLERLMDGDEEFDPDRLLEMDVDMMLMEKIETHLKERTNAQGRFEDIMWDLKTDGRIEK